MLFTADQLVVHAIGDYVIQSDWMANEKTKKSVAALAHALTYTAPFAFLTKSLWALFIIGFTHFIIDRWRLARYVCWLKNWLLSPPDEVISQGAGRGSAIHVIKQWRYPWKDCNTTGYYKDRPPFLAVWLLIICDNLMHVTINAFALRYL